MINGNLVSEWDDEALQVILKASLLNYYEENVYETLKRPQGPKVFINIITLCSFK